MAEYLRSARETMGILIQIVFVAAAAVRVITGQEGFVSIDCGMDEDGSIKDNITGIVYQPDTRFIDTGINYKIHKSYLTSWSPPQVETLRSFPYGDRNCYTIEQVNQGEKYLIRAFFLYGNYDGQDSASIDSLLQFELHLGVNYWETVNVTSPSYFYFFEIITVAKDDYFSVCLVNTGLGTPFISSLELRLIDSVDVYKDVNQSNSLVLRGRDRANLGGSPGLIRYPNDIYDRIWWSLNNPPIWLRISTSETIQINPGDAFQVPSIIMSSAVTPSDDTSLRLSMRDLWKSYVRPVRYCYMHFAEFDALPLNKTRLIDVIVNEQILQRNFRPSYLLSTHITLTFELESSTPYNLSLTKAAGSILPPILNAVEVYTALSLPDLASDRTDVGAMMELKKLYNKKIWQGDPCAPQHFTWEGILCTHSGSNPPRVTSLNLSSLKLTGNIPPAINNLKAIEHLDLSNNNFTGPIPNFLSGLSSLRMLNLSNNQLNGSIPSALRQKQDNGLLELRTENNPDLCPIGNKCVDDHGNKKTLGAPVIVVVAVIPILLLLLAIVLVVRRQKRRKTPTPPSPAPFQGQPEKATSQPENRGFTYLELKTITNNFERVLGKGGFGTVYYGRLQDGTEVAVKLRARTSAQQSMFDESQTEESDSKAQRIKEFQAEALLLSRVHHRNLVSLIGYCKDDNCLALVYEFAAQGSLKDHLTDKDGTSKVLNWRERLQIAIDAATGLEYLHKGCTPPIIHRDVKPNNILLSQNFVAKIADFGVSKAFLADDHTHISTKVIAGTPGYMDPEYQDTFQLNEKGDVYSFGVVLLELITGLQAVPKNPERGHIVPWVRQRLARGDITDVIDAVLKGEYDTNSVWNVADTAMNCTMPTASQRPTMSEVVTQLKESLQLELGRERAGNIYERAQNIYVEALELDQIDLLGTARTDAKTTVSGPTAR